MCLEESFCPFTRGALNFRQPVFRFPLSTAPCDAPLYHSFQLPLMLTGVPSNNAPTRKLYVTLVYLLLFEVALLCCDMLW